MSLNHPMANREPDEMNNAQAKDFLYWIVIETALCELEPDRHTADELAILTAKKPALKAKLGIN